jgi:tetratricopeptide (TPR) repeat protein
MLVLVGSLGFASSSLGQTDDLAKGHYMAAQAYYNQARYAEAIREFQEAYRLSPKPALLYNIAQAYERMGKIDEAVAHLKKYLAAGPDPSDRGALEERLKNLEARLKQTGIAIACEVAGATVLLDGKEVGKTPLPGLISVAPGSHAVKVVKEGHESFSAFVSVNAGQAVQVAAKLEPSGSTTGGGGSAVRQRSYLWTWILGGTAAALLITGGATGGVALNKANAAQRKDDSDASSAKTFALVSDITIGVGAAAAVGAVILLIVERRRGHEAPTATVAPMIGPSVAGLNARFNF